MKMDWEKEANAEGGTFTVYPEGTYKVCINSFEQVTASTGTKQIRWKTSIVLPTSYAGKPFTIHTPLTEKALWKLAKLVKACGVDTKALGTTEVGSNAFLHALERCNRRTAYWHLAVVSDNKGNPKNEVDDFKLDDEQQLQETVEIDDIPEFLK